MSSSCNTKEVKNKDRPLAEKHDYLSIAISRNFHHTFPTNPQGSTLLLWDLPLQFEAPQPDRAEG